MSDVREQYIETILDIDERKDVTADYEEAVQMFVNMAEYRTVPIPLDRAIVYEEESRPEHVVFSFVVDTNEDVLGDTVYMFEIAARKEIVSYVGSDGNPPDDVQTGRVLDTFSRNLKQMQEEIWEQVVHLEPDTDDE